MDKIKCMVLNCTNPAYKRIFATNMCLEHYNWFTKDEQSTKI